jgi:hypothetical protein
VEIIRITLPNGMDISRIATAMKESQGYHRGEEPRLSIRPCKGFYYALMPEVSVADAFRRRLTMLRVRHAVVSSLPTTNIVVLGLDDRKDDLATQRAKKLARR